MSNYELTYILRPLEEANLTALNERVNTIVKNAGGEIVARNDWGRRRLAYPIRKNNDGYYSTLFVTMPGASVRGVERALQLNDDVMRYLVVRVEEFKIPAVPPVEAPAPTQAETAPVTEPVAEASPSNQAPTTETPTIEAKAELDTAPAVVAEE